MEGNTESRERARSGGTEGYRQVGRGWGDQERGQGKGTGHATRPGREGVKGGKAQEGKGGQEGGGRWKGGRDRSAEAGPEVAKLILGPRTAVAVRNTPPWTELEVVTPLACVPACLVVAMPRIHEGRSPVIILQFATEQGAREAQAFLHGAGYGPRGNPDSDGKADPANGTQSWLPQ